MSGFGAWAAGPGGTAGLLACMLALGVILGWLARDTAVRRALADRRGEAEGARYVGELLETDPEAMARRAAMARRTRPVYREKRTSTAAFLDPQQQAIGLASRFIDPDLMHEAWLAHQEQAIALTRPETDEEWFGTHVAAVADEIIGWARAASVPYPDGEPRSGQ